MRSTGMGCRSSLRPISASEVIRRAVGYGMTNLPRLRDGDQAHALKRAARRQYFRHRPGPQYSKRCQTVLPSDISLCRWRRGENLAKWIAGYYRNLGSDPSRRAIRDAPHCNRQQHLLRRIEAVQKITKITALSAGCFLKLKPMKRGQLGIIADQTRANT